jgi:hypothetical protein
MKTVILSLLAVATVAAAVPASAEGRFDHHRGYAAHRVHRDGGRRFHHRDFGRR